MFAAAVATLWLASSSVVGREERRALANDRLKRASDLLDARGQDILTRIRPYPEYMEPEEWAAIDRELARAIQEARDVFPDVEGGFYLPDRSDQPLSLDERYALGLTRIPEAASSPSQGTDLYGYVETQADAAFRKKHDLSVVEEIPPHTVAIRATPVRIGGRVVGAVWTMTRLDDPIFLDHPGTAFRLFAGLALGGSPCRSP